MKKTILIYMTLAVGIFIMPSCKKKKGCMDPISISYDKDAEEDDGSCAYAGSGGNTTIVAKPKHHGVPITNKVGWVDSAFVKFNAENQPSSYDMVIAGEELEDHVHIPGLKPGKYYIFMTGFDSTILQRVSGGMPYVLTQASGEVELDVAVSE